MRDGKIKEYEGYYDMFYHVSKIDHGAVFTFTPRVPERAFVSREGNIPRVCVAPDVYSCLKSISSQKMLYSMDIILEMERSGSGFVPMTVYGTKETPYLPPRVSDFKVTNEHWFLSPITMRRVGYISAVALTRGRVKVLKRRRLVPAKSLAGDGKDVIVVNENPIEGYYI